jgi:hypothetical protein
MFSLELETADPLGRYQEAPYVVPLRARLHDNASRAAL